MSHHSLFAAPWKVPAIEDCHFYHVMDLPGYPPTQGDWDLRSGVDEYLGGMSLRGRGGVFSRLR